jgi:DNA-binding CsgD family transcriptional regulator
VFLKNAAELTSYLAGGDPSGEEIARHLVLKSFAELSPTALYIAELSDDGYVTPVAAFGFDRVALANWGKFPLAMQIPITEAVRNDRCILIDSAEELLRRYPIVGEMEDVSYDWASVLALPMLPFGVAFAVLGNTPTWDEELEHYLRLVGSVVALHLIRAKNSKEIPEFHRGRTSKPNGKDLSNRQKVILEMLSKGATNAEMALEIGYSESLIRQETIEIYRILGVSGRKELITSAGER